MAEVAGLKDQMAAAEEEERRLATELQDRLSGIPNAPLPEVPDGADESANVRLRRDLEPRQFDFARSEEHTSELQSLMRISYAVFCLKKKKKIPHSQQMSII